jgi:hypothetical protein
MYYDVAVPIYTHVMGGTYDARILQGGSVSRIRYVSDTDTQRIRHGYVSEPYYEFRIRTEVDTCI